MYPFRVVYSEKQVSNPNQDPIYGVVSPSAEKPKIIAEALRKEYPDLEFWKPRALKHEDFYRAHSKEYVDGIFDKTRKNGFGTISDSVNESLLYTSGAMYDSCLLATPEKPVCALVSGFHHAGYDRWEGLGYFCTFNGLMVSALRLKENNPDINIAIVDCDMHWGNGTDDILDHLGNPSWIQHYTFGRRYFYPFHAQKYLEDLDPEKGVVKNILERNNVNLVIYQSGADVHVDDPFGGVLTEEQMMERDRRMFTIAKNLKIPLAWCLAGGYQVDADGGIGTVVRLHLNTFKMAEEVYGR